MNDAHIYEKKDNWSKRCANLRNATSSNDYQRAENRRAVNNSSNKTFQLHLNPYITALIASINTAVILLNRNGTILEANNLFLRMLNIEASEIESRLLVDLIVENWRTDYRLLFERADQEADFHPTHEAREIGLHYNNGSNIKVDLSLSIVPGTDENLLMGIVHDLSSHKQELNRLTRMACSDYLTGLANRHTFSEKLETYWRECHVGKLPLSLLFIDVDYFKQFNDLYGHINGDKCLKKIADAISLAMPDNGCTVARYGGEEFAVLLPRISHKMAHMTAIRIRRNVEQLCFAHLGLNKDVKVTVSVGIGCQINAHFESVEVMLQKTDEALYKAKQAGRNQIVSI